MVLKKNNFPYKKYNLPKYYFYLIINFNVDFSRPIFQFEKDEMEELPENNAELLLEHVEEEMVWTDSDENEENILDINDLSVLNKVNLLIICLINLA